MLPRDPAPTGTIIAKSMFNIPHIAFVSSTSNIPTSGIGDEFSRLVDPATQSPDLSPQIPNRTWRLRGASNCLLGTGLVTILMAGMNYVRP